MWRGGGEQKRTRIHIHVTVYLFWVFTDKQSSFTASVDFADFLKV